MSICEDQLKGILKNYGKNGHEKMSKQELKLSFKEMGLRFCRWRAGKAIRRADINQDGYINEQEMGELVKYTFKWGITIY